jgi:hypothetical protein
VRSRIDNDASKSRCLVPSGRLRSGADVENPLPTNLLPAKSVAPLQQYLRNYEVFPLKLKK